MIAESGFIPTIESQRAAARLACKTERSRVLAILALAEPPIAAAILTAIDEGTPAAQASKRLVGENAKTGSGLGAAAAKGKRSWDGITAKLNAQARAGRPAKSGTAA